MCLVAVTALSVLPDPFAKEKITFSSQYNVELGKPYPVIDGRKWYLRADEGVLCVKEQKGRWFIQKLSAQTLTQSSRKEYADMPKDLVVEYIGYFGDKLMFFYSLWDKKNEREQLFYREIDPVAGTFMGKATKLLSINGKVTGSMMMSGFYRFQVTDKFDILFSEDGKRMLVQYDKKLDRKERKEAAEAPKVLSMAVYGSSMELEWKQDVKMPYNTDKMAIKDFLIDNKGDLCLVASVYHGSATKAKDREDFEYAYEFIRSSGGGEWDITKLDLQPKGLRSMTLFEDKTGTLRAAGYYSNDRKRSTVDGLFVSGFNSSDEMVNTGFYEIPNEIINMYTRAKEVKKNEKQEAKGEDIGFNHLTLSGIIQDDDGEILLIGEKQYITVECTTDSRGNTRCYNVYHADDLLVSQLGANGQLKWMQRIPKRVASRAPVANTYRYVYSNGMHHFIRFDVDRNVALAKDDTPTTKGEGIIMVDRIDEATGNVEREAVCDVNEVGGIKLYQLGLNRLIRVGDNELVMEAYKKSKEDVLVRIQVKD